MSADIATLAVAIDSSPAVTAKNNLRDLASVSKSVEQSVGALEGVFLRLGSAIASWKTIEYVKDTALLAARYETLGVAMNTIGTTAGYSLVDLDRYENALRGTGITAIAARESIVKLAAANVDLDKATRLARAAQDIAVINNLNSSDAFNKMVQGIQTGQVRLLHSMGIMATFQEAYKSMAHQLGKTTGSLTDYEKVQARTNIVLEYAEKLTGAYEAALGTVGKQFRTMERFAQDLRTELGALFAPALVVIAQALNDAFASLAQNIAMSRAAGDFSTWQAMFATLAKAVVSVTQFIVEHRGAIIALVAAYATLSVIQTVIPMVTGLVAAWRAAVAATVVMDATLGTVVTGASKTTAALNILNTAITSMGGPWAVLAAAVVAVGTALMFSSDSLHEMNEKVHESVAASARNVSVNRDMLMSLRDMAKAESDAKDSKKYLKDHEEDLAIAKQKILGLGPEYNNAMITETKNVKDLAQAYALITVQELERKIKTTEALIKSYAQEAAKAGKVTLFDALWTSNFNASNNLMDGAIKRIEEITKKSTAAKAELGVHMEALKKIQDAMKQGMNAPAGSGEDDKKKIRDAARKLEDDRYALQMALLRADKAESDEEKYRLAVKIAQLEVDHKILEIRRQFADGKVAGGAEAMQELINGWKQVAQIQKDSAARDLTASQIKRGQEQAKKIAEGEKSLQSIMDQVDEVLNGGYAKSIDTVIKQYDKFRDTATGVYDLILVKARLADLANGEIMGPHTMKALEEFYKVLDKINAAGAKATGAVTAQATESQVSKIKAHLAELEKKHGALTFEEEVKAADEYAKKMGFLTGTMKQFREENKRLQEQSGNWWGGVVAGIRDFGKSATDIFGNVRKATMDWLNNLSSKLTEALMTGKANFKDFAKSVISDIINIIIKAMLFQAIMSGLKSMGYDTSWMTMAVSTKAAGGGVNAGQSYIVGENGPEIFRPTGSGNIVNNTNAVGGMRDVNLTLVIKNDGSGAQVSGDQSNEFGKRLLDRVRGVVIEEINNQKRVGNSLNPIGAR